MSVCVKLTPPIVSAMANVLELVVVPYIPFNLTSSTSPARSDGSVVLPTPEPNKEVSVVVFVMLIKAVFAHLMGSGANALSVEATPSTTMPTLSALMRFPVGLLRPTDCVPPV